MGERREEGKRRMGERRREERMGGRREEGRMGEKQDHHGDSLHLEI